MLHIEAMGKITVLLFTIFALSVPFLHTDYPKPVYALSSVLGARVNADEGVSINGYIADDPKEPILLETATPTFSGYTNPNVTIILIIRSEPIERQTLSDATGYWSYTMDTPIPAGQHTLSLKITDQYGITSDETLAATFTTPEVKGESTIPPSPTTPPIPRNPVLNYFSTTLIVLGSLLLLAVGYFFLSRKTPLRKH